MLNDTIIGTFKASLRGELIQRSDADYEEARKLYNGMIDKRHLMIAGCVHTADVIHAVRFGRENNLLLPYAAAATTVRDWRSAVEQGDEADERWAYWTFAAYPRCWADQRRPGPQVNRSSAYKSWSVPALR